MKADKTCIYCARWVAATQSEPVDHEHNVVSLNIEDAEAEGRAIRAKLLEWLASSMKAAPAVDPASAEPVVTMTAVRSSQVEAVGFRRAGQLVMPEPAERKQGPMVEVGFLYVRFRKGGVTYRYFDVPQTVYENLLAVHKAGGSIGTSLDQHVKKAGYKFEKL